MKCYFDLHIHTCLSPCSDDDMTPNNIVNMALLKGLDVIAVTDHNSMGNVDAVIKASKGKDICVLYGMELETSEEVHIVTFFSDKEGAARFEEVVKASMPDIKNREDIFGRQILMDSNDNITGDVENMLVTASGLSIYDARREIEKCKGVFIPAHIDRDSYSIMSNLGFIPDDLSIRTVEISKNTTKEQIIHKFPMISGYNIISSSDAHHLWDINERENYMEIESVTPENIINYLSGM